MKELWVWLIELLSLVGLVAILAYVKWSLTTLGAVLTLIGAFFPKMSTDKSKKTKGSAKVKSKNLSLIFRGSLRIGVILAGLLLVIGGVANVPEEKKIAEEKATFETLKEIQLLLPLVESSRQEIEDMSPEEKAERIIAYGRFLQIRDSLTHHVPWDEWDEEDLEQLRLLLNEGVN